jgi:molybdopterin converting factor small subunit
MGPSLRSRALPMTRGGGGVAVLRLFAGAREAAGTGRDDVPGTTVSEVLDAARARYGAPFAEVLEHCQIWRNGEPCELDDAVLETDEVAVLPPVSGGAA